MTSAVEVRAKVELKIEVIFICGWSRSTSMQIFRFSDFIWEFKHLMTLYECLVTLYKGLVTLYVCLVTFSNWKFWMFRFFFIINFVLLITITYNPCCVNIVFFITITVNYNIILLLQITSFLITGTFSVTFFTFYFLDALVEGLPNKFSLMWPRLKLGYNRRLKHKSNCRGRRFFVNQQGGWRVFAKYQSLYSFWPLEDSELVLKATVWM